MDVSFRKRHNTISIEGLSEKGKRWVQENTDPCATIKEVQSDLEIDILKDLQEAGVAVYIT